MTRPVPHDAHRPATPRRLLGSLSIVQKIQLLLALMIAGVLVVLYVFLSQVVSQRIAAIEHDTAAHAVENLQKELDNQREQIERITTDYAVWDDTYDFLRGDLPTYIERNFVDSTFDSNHIDLIILADSEGLLRYVRVLGPNGDLSQERQVVIADTVIGGIVVDTAITQDDTASSVLNLPDGPVLISARPVLMSDYTGPSNGILIMGRRLDADTVAEIEDQLSATVRFSQLTDLAPGLVSNAASTLQAGEPLVIETEGDAWIHGFTLIRDLTDQPVLIGQITQPRSIWAAGQQMVIWTLITCLITGGFAIGFLTFLLNRFILRRLDQLIAGVRQIGVDDATPPHIQLSGDDELSELATTINKTLSTVDAQRAYLTTLYATTLELLNHRELDDLLQIVVDRATSILDAPYGELLIREGDELVVRACAGNFQKGSRARRHEAEILWQACERAQPVVVAEGAASDLNNDRYGELNVCAVVVLPIMATGVCQGVLVLGRSASAQRFTDQEIWKGRLFAQLVALVLESASLYDTAQREIGERRAVERALQESARELQAQNAELDSFGHTVAHDLKTPLTAIIGYCQLLQATHHMSSADAIDDNLKAILAASDKMTTIINELMLLARLRRSDTVVYGAIEMGSIIAEVTTRLRHMIAKAEACVTLPPDWPLAIGYAPWVEEVWVNYVSNALKYGGTPPTLVLGADPPAGGFVRFWVRDNGPGITPEEQAQLFSVFSRLRPARVDGHGLGLSIVSRIVSKLGGQVGVESAPGGGSTFFFTLPEPLEEQVSSVDNIAHMA